MNAIDERFKSLTAKLLAINVPMVSIALLALFTVLEVQYYRTERAELVRSLHSLADLQSSAFASNVWEYDTDQIAVLLGELANLPHLQSAVVLDDSAAVLGSIGDIDARPEAPDLTVEQPLVYRTGEHDVTVGTLVVTFHSGEIWKDVEIRFKINALTLVVLLATLIGVTLVAVRVVIGRPINRLLSSIERMRSDRVLELVDWQSADELGRVVDAYNEMQERQEIYERELEEARGTLELRVEERTRELKDSEARFRAVIDQLPVAMVLKDAEGRFTIANKTFSEWFAKDGEEIVGKTSHDLYPKDVADKLRAIDLEILRSGTIIDEEIDEPFVDGSIHSMLMTKFPILGPGGKAVAVGTIETDITERKRAEEELTEKEAQLRLAMDNMSSGMRLVDKDRCNVLFNSRYIELYDYPEGLLKVGESIRVENVYAANRGDFGPGDPEKLADEWLANSPELTRTLSWESRTADGRKLQVSTTPIPSGGVINMVSDITERKRAEEELEQKEAQLRLALDNMQGGMRLIDKDRNYVFFNQQYLDLYDYPEGLLKVGVSIRVENLYSAQRGDFGPGDPDALTDQSLAGLSVQGEATSWERLITGGKTLRVHGGVDARGRVCQHRHRHHRAQKGRGGIA